MTIMYPTSVKFESWANDLKRSLPSLNVPFPHRGVDNWHLWVKDFIGVNRAFNIPFADTQQYPKTEDWRKWAIQFIQLMNSLKTT